MSNLFIFNSYRWCLKVIRLSLSVICCLFCCLLISCTNSPQNPPTSVKKEILTAENAVNLNIASVEELQRLPKIGEGIAKRIVEHRGRFGKFRRTEHLILVKGMSDKKFREIQHLIKVE